VVTFEGSVSHTGPSIIALDDVTLEQGVCPPPEPELFDCNDEVSIPVDDVSKPIHVA
jgi:hypothetical protein